MPSSGALVPESPRVHQLEPPQTLSFWDFTEASLPRRDRSSRAVSPDTFPLGCGGLFTVLVGHPGCMYLFTSRTPEAGQL